MTLLATKLLRTTCFYPIEGRTLQFIAMNFEKGTMVVQLMHDLELMWPDGNVSQLKWSIVFIEGRVMAALNDAN